MSQTAPAHAPAGVGIIKIAGKELFVRKLSQAREQQFRRHLGRIAKENLGPGGFFQRAQPTLEWLRAQKSMFAEWQMTVETLAKMSGGGALPDDNAIFEARESVAGVVLELFLRTRDTHPNLGKDEIAAIITEANVLDVHLEILDALTDEGKAETPAGSQGN